MKIEGLVDGAARRSIREELDRTLVVEAAAGTGKTTELVQRIVAMVASGRARLSSIVSVTFTEKAAGEMKLRIRTELDRALLEGSSTPLGSLGEPARARLIAALSELETAKVGTIHALCAELLREHPIEARVDPAFEVADTMLSRALSERAFDAWFERTLEAPAEGVRRILARRAFDEKSKSAREQLLAAAGRLIETRDFATPYRRDPFDREVALRVLHDELTALAALGERAYSKYDPLGVSLRELAQRLLRVQHVDDDQREAFFRTLSRDRKVWNEKRGSGQQYGSELARAAVLEARSSAKQHLATCVMALDADLAACLSRELAPVVQAYELEKRSQGTLDFFDLLLFTRDLLRDHDEVRRRVQREVTHLFVDEFQDTDPVQSELLLLISADDPSERDPWKVRPVPGKLFVVGDPKQSIYRFRRADVALYEAMKQHLVSLGAVVLQLSTSFRSLPDIQSLVNAAFAPLMSGDASKGQASYVQLSAFRAARTSQPAVVALPVPRPYSDWGKLTKKAVNASLPDAVAAWIDWLVHKSGYVVHEAGRDVPVEARHVCLLFRRFRDWSGDVTREYVRALEARRVPHVLSGGRSFHAREEVIALRAVLTALEWPEDSLHVYATLRGPFVALHDETLLSFKRKVKHLHPLGPVDLTVLSEDEAQVATVLGLLAELHRMRNRRPIADTISLLLHALRVHAGIAIWPTGEQALGNVLRVLDYARSYERPGRATSFRGFVEWLAQHAELGETADAPVIEESSDGVRVMTVHAAKGLEFPVVVLCDPTMKTRPEYPTRFIDLERRLWAQSLCESEPSELTEQRELMRDQEEAEAVRVAYVAVTRAKELLVIPVTGDGCIEGWTDPFRPALYPPSDRRRNPDPAPGCPHFAGDSVIGRPIDLPHGPEASVAPGQHRPIAGEHRVVWWDPYLLELTRGASGGVTQQELLRADEQASGPVSPGLLEYQAFRVERVATREQGALASFETRAMTQLAAEVEPGLTVPVEVIDSGAQRHGRPSGTRFGVLVHALFEHAVLGEGADAATELLAVARYVGRSIGASEPEQTRAVEDVTLALAHPLFARVRQAQRAGELFREAPVTVCTEPATLREGAVDLAFRERTPEGSRVVIVDFKTDVALGDLRVYQTQLSLYADALQRALGEPVVCILFRV
ncbi:MAG: ATP-dependent nuclease, subunit [Myxococcaceae bacterium]|nr:ATP-dependent nuclease, subunit [Myxococcaceae bacterium]